MDWLHFMLTQPCAEQMIASLQACARIWEVLARTLPKAVYASNARATLLTNRTFHFAAKYWLACGCIMVTVVILQQEYPTSRHWQLQYPFLTIPIVFGERVSNASAVPALFEHQIQTAVCAY